MIVEQDVGPLVREAVAMSFHVTWPGSLLSSAAMIDAVLFCNAATAAAALPLLTSVPVHTILANWCMLVVLLHLLHLVQCTKLPSIRSSCHGMLRLPALVADREMHGF